MYYFFVFFQFFYFNVLHEISKIFEILAKFSFKIPKKFVLSFKKISKNHKIPNLQIFRLKKSSKIFRELFNFFNHKIFRNLVPRKFQVFGILEILELRNASGKPQKNIKFFQKKSRNIEILRICKKMQKLWKLCNVIKREITPDFGLRFWKIYILKNIKFSKKNN